MSMNVLQTLPSPNEMKSSQRSNPSLSIALKQALLPGPHAGAYGDCGPMVGGGGGEEAVVAALRRWRRRQQAECPTVHEPA